MEREIEMDILDVIQDIKDLTGLSLVELRDKLKEYGKDTNVRSNGWIPVEERLPNEDGEYLTCDEHGNIHIFHYYVDGKFPFSIPPWHNRYYQPIAWQEKPKPYQKGE